MDVGSTGGSFTPDMGMQGAHVEESLDVGQGTDSGNDEASISEVDAHHSMDTQDVADISKEASALSGAQGAPNKAPDIGVGNGSLGNEKVPGSLL